MLLDLILPDSINGVATFIAAVCLRPAAISGNRSQSMAIAADRSRGIRRFHITRPVGLNIISTNGKPDLEAIVPELENHIDLIL